ncbi:hypothetical protein [Sulfobacillus thermosulfidooxidans]|uniref:hypothetical protein n=1 Tax=Sulfobacillus thermosulfidooxidans TaxID=28034 RepID=UPI0006B59F58|nr:hypothetical protein [Sulfobacillus thermosulfidooxidans]
MNSLIVKTMGILAGTCILSPFSPGRVGTTTNTGPMPFAEGKVIVNSERSLSINQGLTSPYNVVSSSPDPAPRSGGLTSTQIVTQEQKWIAQYNHLHHAQFDSVTGTAPTAATIARQNAYIVQLKQESQTPQFQQQLTRQWEAQHPSSSSIVIKSNEINIPVGAINVTTTYQPSSTMHIDDGGTKYASDLTIAYTIADDIATYFLSTVGNIVLDVANLLGISLNSYVPMSSELWHTYRYGYKNVYVWNGASWVLCLTTGDRQWFKHATISYVPDGSSYTTGTTYNWLPPAYGPIHTDFSYLWNNSSLMDQEAESNFQRGIYTYVPWYNS